MLQPITLYVTTAVIFLALDVIGLKYLIRPVFETHIGPLLLETPRWGPAAIFYLFYIAALLWLVSWPSYQTGDLARLALNAAIFGAVTYGTYEFTNLATLKDWSWSQVWLDLGWGIALTTVAATGGAMLTRSLTG